LRQLRRTHDDTPIGLAQQPRPTRVLLHQAGHRLCPLVGQQIDHETGQLGRIDGSHQPIVVAGNAHRVDPTAGHQRLQIGCHLAHQGHAVTVTGRQQSQRLLVMYRLIVLVGIPVGSQHTGAHAAAVEGMAQHLVDPLARGQARGLAVGLVRARQPAQITGVHQGHGQTVAALRPVESFFRVIHVGSTSRFKNRRCKKRGGKQGAPGRVRRAARGL
jgi:hypothetical protein